MSISDCSGTGAATFAEIGVMTSISSLGRPSVAPPFLKRFQRDMLPGSLGIGSPASSTLGWTCRRSLNRFTNPPLASVYGAC